MTPMSRFWQKGNFFFFEHVLYLLSQILILRWGKGHNSLFARVNKKEHIEWLPPLKNYFFTIIQSSGEQLLNFFLKRKKLRLKIFKFLYFPRICKLQIFDVIINITTYYKYTFYCFSHILLSIKMKPDEMLV